MLQELLKKKIEEIDKESQRQKSAVQYLVSIIEEDEEMYATVFAQEKGETVSERMFNGVEKTIKKLESEYGKPGVISVVVEKDYGLPEIKLGWSLYDEIKEKTYLEITDKGKEIINGYRSAQGLCTLDEKAQIRGQAWTDFIDKAQSM